MADVFMAFIVMVARLSRGHCDLTAALLGVDDNLSNSLRALRTAVPVFTLSHDGAAGASRFRFNGNDGARADEHYAAVGELE
jgi:hypothetical protein